MEESKMENSLDEKKRTIRRWLSNKYNLYFLGILLFALVIRLYYFSMTLNQPLWWDEAEYMNMARAWAFNLDYEFLSVRPVLFPLITALFFKIVYSEFLPRFFMMILSMISVVGMYYLGKEIYDERVGLISALLTSVFYVNLFYTSRLLVEIPSFVFFIFSALFFYKYFQTKSNKMVYWGAVFVAIGTLFKLTNAVFLFVVLIYLLITEKFKFVKRKELWISGLIFILILSPYLLWGYIQFDGFVITQAGAWNAPEDHYLSNGWCNMKAYSSMLISMLSWPLLIIFLLGFFFMYELVLGLDVLLRGEDSKLNKYLYLVLLFIIPIISVSLSVGSCWQEDRYILNSFSSVFIISSAFILMAYNSLKKNKKSLAILFLVLVLGLLVFLQFQHSDNIITLQKDSYSGAKESGIWLKENSEISDIILTSSWPMTGYYSERKISTFPSSSEEMDSLRENNSNLKYFMISNFQKSPDWTYSYPDEKKLEIAQVYFQDAEKTQPAIIIYKLK